MNTRDQRILELKRTKPIFIGLLLAGAMMLTQSVMAASPAPVALGSCSNFTILAATAVSTDGGGGIINGDVGLSPGGGSSITVLTAAQVNGTIYAVDVNGPAGSVMAPVLLNNAQNDLTVAYLDAQGRSLNQITVAGNIGGQTLAPGLYWSAGSIQVTGDLTLDAGGDPNAVWIFQMASTLTTAAGGVGDPHSRIILAGGAAASNVFWQVGSSATLGSYSVFAGTIMAHITITMGVGSVTQGRALAQTGAVTFNGGGSGSLPTQSGPIAVDDVTNTPVNTAVTVAVLNNDTDADGDTLIVTGVTNSVNGTAVTNLDGTILFTPDAGFVGFGTFTYSISDGHGGLDSATCTITVGAVYGGGDVDMCLDNMECVIDWASHAHGNIKDRLSISGVINPSGADLDLSGANMVLWVNDVQLLPAVALDKQGKAKGKTGGVAYKFQLSWLNGSYSLDMVGLDLSPIMGVSNVTATILQDVSMRLVIENGNLAIPIVLGTFECPCSTKAGKTSQLSFQGQTNRTITGMYQCRTTKVWQQGEVYSVQVRGSIEADGGDAVVPTGDITVTIGNATLVIPFAQLIDNGSFWSYKYKNGLNNGLIQFQLKSRSHTFYLLVSDLAATGIPFSATGATEKHLLKVQLQVPMASGVGIFDSTVEILRLDGRQTRWMR
jgi:hypothetical protein